MLKNYLVVTIRNLLRDKFYSFINILGLVLGISSSILIMFYIYDELSYDRMHSKADRIYRMNEFTIVEPGERSSSLPFIVGTTLVDEYPALIESQVRFFNYQSPTLLLENKITDKSFNEARLFFADSTFFDVFDFDLLKGDKASALENPNALMITESMARKYFGNEDPMGKILRFQDELDLIITGVMPDAPLNNHFQFDFIGSISTVKHSFGGRLPQTWYWNPCWTYLLLKEGVEKEDVESIFPNFVVKYFPDFMQGNVELKLQALTDIHLKSDLEFEIQANSSENNIYAFSMIALLIIFIASFNYMNLSTAKAGNRSKEVGIRKTLGSSKAHLIRQFLLESSLVTTIAIVLSLITVAVVLPSFNAFTEKSISLNMLLQNEIMIGVLFILIIVGIGSGVYPAFVLSAFSPIKGLKRSGNSQGNTFRQVLVIFQFSISIIMIIATVIAIDQLNFLRQDDTGFDKEQVLYVFAQKSPIAHRYDAFKKEVMNHRDVKNMTAVIDALGARHQGDNFRFEGMERSLLFSVFWTKHDFMETFGLDLIAGRSFKKNIISDDTASLVINEAMCRTLDWPVEEAVGKNFQYNRHHGKIIGVVEDFNFTSKHNSIGPLVIQLRDNPGAFNLFIKYLAIKLDTQNMPETLAFLEDKWNEFVPGRPFDYFFLEDELNMLYKDEDKLSKVAGLFSSLAIVVACLGLFALAAFTAEKRKKEIAVRKVLGSSIPQIVVLLSRNFSILIAISFLIASPVAWIFINSWLDNFAFRISLEPYIFILTGAATFLIALLTVSIQTLKAASANPADILKYE